MRSLRRSRPLTYAGLCRHLEQVVGVLNSHGLGRGDRVALVLPNGPEMLTAFLAVGCGRGAAPLNPALTGGEFDFAFQDLRIGAVIVPASTGIAGPRGWPRSAAYRFSNFPSTLTIRRGFLLWAGGRRFRILFDIRLSPATTILLWCFALPVLSLGRRSCRRGSGADRRRRLDYRRAPFGASDRYLCVMPMHHAYALYDEFGALLAGGAAIVVPLFDAGDFFRWLAEFQLTWYSSAPTYSSSDSGARHANTGGSSPIVRCASFVLRPLSCRSSCWQHWKRGLWRACDRRLRHDRRLAYTRPVIRCRRSRGKLARWESRWRRSRDYR